MHIFEESKHFPREEIYSLADQVRRSSRSVANNVGEGYRKRLYRKMFVSKMSGADGLPKLTFGWISPNDAAIYRNDDN